MATPAPLDPHDTNTPPAAAADQQDIANAQTDDTEPTPEDSALAQPPYPS